MKRIGHKKDTLSELNINIALGASGRVPYYRICLIDLDLNQTYTERVRVIALPLSNKPSGVTLRYCKTGVKINCVT